MGSLGFGAARALRALVPVVRGPFAVIATPFRRSRTIIKRRALVRDLGPAAVLAASMIVFSPLTANAYTPEQEQACTGDAFRLCSADIPDIERITACMIRNRAQLSPPCRAQFDAGPDGAASAASPGKPVDINATAARKSVSGKSRKSKKRAKADAT